MSKYVLRMKMKTPDAGVFGWFAWARWSSIVPEGLYTQINPTTQGIGTGPFKLVSYQPNDHVEYTRWPSFWKKGLPYLDALTLKIIPDEQAAIAALQAGAIDGATISADNARSLAGNGNLTVLKGMTAASTSSSSPSRPARTSRGPTAASARRSTSRSTAPT